MVKLEPLQQEDFERFLERGSEYAEDHVHNGNWLAEGAFERSRKEFKHYLPMESTPGINISGHF